MQKKILSLLVIAGSLALGGCATPASVGPMVYHYTEKAPPRNKNFAQAITVENVVGGHGTDPLWTSQISNKNFKAALIDSLKQANLYHQFSGANYKLKATLVKLLQPLAGLDMTVVCEVHYTVTSTASQKIIYNKIITSVYTATFSDALVGATRLKDANEGAARVNIKKFIKAIYQIP